MDLFECISTRRSIRKFRDIPVEFEKIGNILDSGREAPSAGNQQDWKFILITEKEKIAAIANACYEQHWIANASVVIVVCAEPVKMQRFYPESADKFTLLNSGAAVQNMLLTAHYQGLATCWVGAFEDMILKRELGVPDDIIITAVLPIGYADEKPPKPTRFTLEDVTYIEKWDNKIKDIAAYMEWYGEHVQKAFKKGKELIRGLARRLQK